MAECSMLVGERLIHESRMLAPKLLMARNLVTGESRMLDGMLLIAESCGASGTDHDACDKALLGS